MPLLRQLMEIQLSAGLNQKADVRALDPAHAVQMTNCVALKAGAIRKRLGNSLISSASTLPATSVIAGGSAGGVPWVTDRTQLYEYADASSAWQSVGQVPETTVYDRLNLGGINSNLQANSDVDVAYCNGFLVCVFSGAAQATGYNSVLWTVIDPASGAIVVPTNYVAATDSNGEIAPKLVVCGTTVVLVYFNQTGQVLDARTITATVAGFAAGWSAATAITASGELEGNGLDGVYDVAGLDSGRFVVTYQVSHSGDFSVVKTWTTALSNTASVYADTVSNTYTAVGICTSGAGGAVWVALIDATSSSASNTRVWSYVDGVGTPTNVYDFYTWNAPSTDAPGNFISISLSAGGVVTVLFSPWVSTDTTGAGVQKGWIRGGVVQNSSGTLTSLGPTRFLPGVVLASRAVSPGAGVSAGTGYALVRVASAYQGSYLLAAFDWMSLNSSVVTSAARLAATLAPRLSSFPNTTQTTAQLCIPHIVNLPTVGGNTWGLPMAVSTTTSHAALYLERIDFAGIDAYSYCNDGTLCAIGTGTPMSLSGDSLSELGFVYYPELTATFNTTGGSLQTSGSYQLCAVWEWYDRQGNVHRSAVSPVVTLTASGSGNTGSISITSPTLALTYRGQQNNGLLSLSVLGSHPYLVIYRTQANGTLFYRTTGDPPGSANYALPSVQTLSLTDTASDASIATSALIYTTGGVLENTNPPTARCVLQFQNRIVLSGCDDPTAVWPSKELTPGEAPGFNEAQNFTCSGAVRAMATQDGNWIFFVQRGASYGIEYVTGIGPTDEGTLSSWTEPQPIPSDAGAVNQRGVCSGPFGTLFRSTVGGPNGDGGIFLLDRSLQVHYLSGPVEDILSANPIVTSMNVHPTNGRVYITAISSWTKNGSGYLSGVRLVWDYIQGVWSQDLLADPSTGLAGAGATTGFVASTGVSQDLAYGAQPLAPRYFWSDVNAKVSRENLGMESNAYLDQTSTSTAWVSMTFTTSFIRAQVKGFARWWRVILSSDTLTPAQVAMTLTYDGAPASYYSEVGNWTDSAIATFDRYPITDILMTPGNQKAAEIQVTLSDSAPTSESIGTGQGFSWSTLTFEMGIKQGQTYKNLPAAQRN